MIELNKKTQQDFLNREWVQRLLDAGVDMSDAKYCIIRKQDNKDYIAAFADFFSVEGEVTPTYTTAELLYKLHEWIYPTIDGKEFSGPLYFIKDAPFYMFYYRLRADKYNPTIPSKDQVKEWNDQYIYAEYEYPIESLASLLIQCQKKDIGIKRKDINISNK